MMTPTSIARKFAALPAECVHCALNCLREPQALTLATPNSTPDAWRRDIDSSDVAIAQRRDSLAKAAANGVISQSLAIEFRLVAEALRQG